MNMIFFLIGCSILLALVFLAAFFWASKTGQHDDTYTPSVRILFDDELTVLEPEDNDDTREKRNVTKITIAQDAHHPIA